MPENECLSLVLFAKKKKKKSQYCLLILMLFKVFENIYITNDYYSTCYTVSVF